MITRICAWPCCTATATKGLGTYVRSVSRQRYHMIELDCFMCDRHADEIDRDYRRRREIADVHRIPESIEANFQKVGDPVDWSTLKIFGVPAEMAAFNHDQCGAA